VSGTGSRNLTGTLPAGVKLFPGIENRQR